MTWEKEDFYVEAPEGAVPITHTRSHQWNHAVGEILTALLGAGLVLEEVGETRVSAWRRWPDLMEPCEGGYRFADPATREMLPLQLLVAAHRPAAGSSAGDSPSADSLAGGSTASPSTAGSPSAGSAGRAREVG